MADESDPLSVDPDLDPFDARNGFAEPPESSSYVPEFVALYREAQNARVRRIDAVAKEYIDESRAADRAFKEEGRASDRRRGLTPRIITVFRTDADLRNVDLSLDPRRASLRLALRQAPRPDELWPARLRPTVHG